MDMENKQLRDQTTRSLMPMPDRDRGFYHSQTVFLPIEDVYDFLQKKENVEKVLTNLPHTMNNFLQLEFVGASEAQEGGFEVNWKNSEKATFQGTLTFVLKEAPANRGTYVAAVAVFDKFSWRDEEPSDLMNGFLKRLKMLMETGQIATTKGQPSGREEISATETKTIQ